jgi:hypothetical protein
LLRTVFRIQKAGLLVRSILHFRRSLSCPTTRRNISAGN